MILPSPQLLRLLAWGAPLWLLAAVLPPFAALGAAWLLGLLILASLEARGAARPAQLHIERHFPTRLSYDEEATVSLHVSNLSEQRMQLLIRDEVPDELGAPEQVFELDLPPGAEGRLHYPIRPSKRGHFRYGDVVLRAQTGRGLVSRELRLPLKTPVKVYPRFRGANDYQLLARIAERDEARRPRRIRGQGSDYESLRPYVQGDDPRLVDWKSSARRGTLISRTPQVEKGQQLALMIDCGRMMANPIGGHSRLEHALDAAVRLSYVVQKRGDTLALAAFSNRIEAFRPSLRGNDILPTVLETLCDVQLRSLESDYWQVTAKMLSMLRRRSLVVLFSEVLDAAASQGLLTNLRRAASRHLVLCVVLAEPALQQVVDTAPNNAREAWRLAAACDLQRRRRLALESMRSCGILVLESTPEQLSHRLIRRYLEIRQADLQ